MGNRERQKEIRRELEALSPKLAEWKGKEKPLEAPARYFEQLPEEVLGRIRRQDAPPAPSGRRRAALWAWIRGPQPKLAYALALATVAGLIIGLLVLTDGPQPAAESDMVLTDEEINGYVERYLDDFDLDLLVEEAATVHPEGVYPTDPDSVEKNAIDEYLDEHLDDLDLQELL